MNKLPSKTKPLKSSLKNIALFSVATMLIFSITACKQITHNYDFTRGGQVQLEPQAGIIHVPASAFLRHGAIEEYAAQIYDDYERRATGPIHMAVSAPIASQAETWATRLGEALAHEGLRGEDYIVTIIPYHHFEVEPGITVSYEAVSVLLPNCATLPQIANLNTGCAIERQIGQMVARPTDLRGVNDSQGYSSTDANLALSRQQNRESDSRPVLLDLVNTTD